MPLLPTSNEKSAARTNRDGLDFVLTMTASSPRKDDTNVYIRLHGAPFKLRSPQ